MAWGTFKVIAGLRKRVREWKGRALHAEKLIAEVIDKYGDPDEPIEDQNLLAVVDAVHTNGEIGYDQALEWMEKAQLFEHERDVITARLEEAKQRIAALEEDNRVVREVLEATGCAIHKDADRLNVALALQRITSTLSNLQIKEKKHDTQ